MGTLRVSVAFLAAAAVGMLVHAAADSDEVLLEKLAHLRNLAKAYYENPNTKKEAVAEFKKALDLRPDSVQERLNYGLALLRGGDTEGGIAELKWVQERDPKLPHTWFNLGIEYKKLGDFEAAIEQFEQMAKLVPDEPVTQYNLGVLYKRAGENDRAIEKFKLAGQLDPSLAAPHFQLFNAYRTARQRELAQAELAEFKKIKAAQEGAVIAEDMNWCFYSEVHEVIEPMAASEGERAEIRFDALPLEGAGDGQIEGMLVMDATGDGAPDLVAWTAKSARLYLGGTKPVEKSGLDDLAGITAAAAGDFDDDGLTDLAVTTASGAALLRNAGGSFAKTEATFPKRRFEKALWLDFDHDNDLDLFLFGAETALMRNQGSAGFADRTADFPFAKGGVVDAVAIRVIPDTKMTDLVVSSADGAGTLYKDRLSAQFEARPLKALPAGARGLTAVDANNDSWIDIGYTSGKETGVLLNRTGRFEAVKPGAQGVGIFADLENRGVEELVAGGRIHRNLGQGRFGPGETAAGLTAAAAGASADFNSDGKIDLVLADENGAARLLTNQTTMSNRWLRVTLEGKKAPKLAPGSEVEVKVGQRYQKKPYHGRPLTFGVGAAPELDTVRITWSNGLIQNQMKQGTNEAATYVEEERLSGSCPMIWTWDGRRFRYITDVLGVGPLGVRIGPDQYFPADHDEYVQLPENALAPRDGRYEIRMTQELAEVVYMDEVKLLAVDHPEETEIFTNEKFSVPAPEFRLWGVRERHYPVAAVNDAGRDVLGRLLKKDRRYLDEFPRMKRRGVARMHALELDFGAGTAPGNDAVLVLSGWVDWAEGSNYAGYSQEDPAGLRSPSLQVRNERGEWQTVVEAMGIPAGMPKTVVVDLADKFLTESRQVRIVTNMCVYWDEIFLATGAGEPAVRMTELRSDEAELRFRGFSRIKADPTRRQPQSFFYDRPGPVAPWSQTPGMYTGYGDVRELLEAVDDRFVIYGPGDEVRMEFDARALPPLAEGWKRTFVLGVEGWEKDQDPNTVTSNTVEPLPFHGMSSYPYGEGEQYPDDEAHREYVEKWLTRPGLRLIRPLVTRTGAPTESLHGE